MPPLKTATCEEGENSIVDGVGPNKEMGPSICTPTQAIQHSGFSPKNSKGGLQRTCKVYLRQRWYKKKQHMGQIHPDALTEKGTTSLHSQHLHNTIQKGIAFNTNYDLSTRPAPQVDDPEGSLETQHLQQASNIWNMAQHLGVTRGDDHHLIIEKIKEMEERDLKEAERLGISGRCP